MKETAALRTALDLLHMPTQIRHIRKAPLPPGLPDLLRIAAGDDAALDEAAYAVRRPRDDVRQAAIFFIEQVLLAQDSDSYRVLGAAPDASNEDLRRNMALIMKYLHPDVDRGGERSLFAARVTAAWNDLKTPQKRARYDLRTGQARRVAAPSVKRRPPAAKARSRPAFRRPVKTSRQGGLLRLIKALLLRLARR